VTATAQPYTIELHRHNFARWCAARAYTRGLKGGGSQVAFELIEFSGLQAITKPAQIGPDVDVWLLGFMRKIVAEAQRRRIQGFSFGHAQKIVNVYLKSVFVCGEYYSHPHVEQLHPPLDRQLFLGLKAHLRQSKAFCPSAVAAFYKAQSANSSWTSFTEEDYVAHISAIQALMVGRPLYKIEEHWSL